MQRHLRRTIRYFCRQDCRRRFYSTQSALQHVVPETPTDSVASTSSRLFGNTEDLKNGDSSAGKKRITSTALNKPPSSLPGAEDASSMPNKVDAYLASLRAEGIEPSLSDLDRLAPKDTRSAKSPKYAEAYMEVVDRLCRTFSKDQLRRFCKELRLDRRYSKPNRKKVEYAEAIMEKEWGWENLKEVEKQKRDASEVAVKSFPVSASELFLLLGKDGSELLQISKTYNVHISVKPDPLSIRIEGFRGSIKKIEALVVERRKSIVEEKMDLPTGEALSPGLLQQVSRTANAFIENIGDTGKIRIRAMNQQRLNLAKRLAFRTSVQIKRNLSIPFAALLPPPPSAISLEEPPSSYALFPFAAQRSLPWTDASGSAFRSRKVSERLSENSRNFTLFSADLSGRKGKLISTNGDMPGLDDIISHSFRDSEGSYIITASTGHVLIMATSQQHRSSILPPFPGRWQYSELLDWMQSDIAHHVFVPCLPVPLHSAPPTQEKIVHRLTYRQVRNELQPPDAGAEFVPVKVIRAEVVINRKKLEEAEPLSAESEEFYGTAGDEAMLDDLLIDDVVEADDLIEGAGETCSRPAGQSCSDSDALGDTSQSVEAQLPKHLDKDTISEVSQTSLAEETVLDETRAPENDKSQESLATSEAERESDSSSEPICNRGREMELLISLPDRPMDIKLTVLGSVDHVPDQKITELDNYFKDLKAYLDNAANEATPPEPPLFVDDGGDKYILDLNASIRQSTESLDLGRDTLSDFDSPRLENLTERRILTTTESIFDLESGQRLVNCEISFKAAPLGEAWASFLTDIDRLTSVGYKTKHSAPVGNSFSLDGQVPDSDNQLF
ncbi:hypothetical protein ACEPAF_3677 [Sanghuangporus sanghuang]